MSFPDYGMNYNPSSHNFQAFNTAPDAPTAPFSNAPPGQLQSVPDGSEYRQMGLEAMDTNTTPDSMGFVGGAESTVGEGSLQLNTDDTGNGDGTDGPGSAKPGDKNEPLPPWSEMKTKAGKERKRLPLACIACRRKKIRCSGEKPACKHCLRSRIPCVYKVTTRKAAPRTDYMAMLDKRLKRMEDRVIKLIPKENLASVAAVGRAVVKPALPGPPSRAPAGKKRAAEEAFGAELDEWAKSKEPESEEGQGRGAPKGRSVEETELLKEGADALPPKAIQQHLAETYFDFVYGQSYPLLHKPSFMRKLDAGLVPPVLMLAVCAISARFSTHPQLRTEPAFLRGESWASAAREIALRRFDKPNITILIVYLLLGLHEFGTCQGGRSWMFGGMAQRMAYALQLHRDLDYDPSVRDGERKKLSFLDREIQRRTMWSCFLMDRFNSSGTDRPLFVNEQFISAQLPIKEHYFQMEIAGPTEDLDGNVPNPVPEESGQLSNPKNNMGVVAYLIRLVTIWGRLIRYMNLGGKEKEAHPMWSPQSTYNQLQSQVHEFRNSLPSSLTYCEENLQTHAVEKTANQFIYLHILYHQILLFMNRFALPTAASNVRPPKDIPQDFLASAARSALDSANQISLLIHEAFDYNVVAPFTGYCAFFSSTVHIHGVFSKNPQLEAQSKRYLAYNVKYLSKIKKYWGMFHFVAENLKDLYRQHADAVLRGAKGSSTNAEGNIFQYGDWFDRYPHGVSKTDYEDPASGIKKEEGADAVLGQKSDLQTVEEFFATLSPPSRAEQQRKMAKKGTVRGGRKSVSEAGNPIRTQAQAQAQAQAQVQAQAQAQAQAQVQAQAQAAQAQARAQHQMNPQPQPQPHLAPTFHHQQQPPQILPHHLVIPPHDANATASTFEPTFFSPTSHHPQHPLQQHQIQQHPQPFHSPPTHNPNSTSPSYLPPPDPSSSTHNHTNTHPSTTSSSTHFWLPDPALMTHGHGYPFADLAQGSWFLPFNIEPPPLAAGGGGGGGGGLEGAVAFAGGLGEATATGFVAGLDGGALDGHVGFAGMEGGAVLFGDFGGLGGLGGAASGAGATGDGEG